MNPSPHEGVVTEKNQTFCLRLPRGLGGCNGCEIEIFATLSPLFDENASALKSFLHRVMRIFYCLRRGHPCNAIPCAACVAVRAGPKICISYGACGNSGGIFHDPTACGAVRIKSSRWMSTFRAPANACRYAIRLCNGARPAGAKIHARGPGEQDEQPAEILHAIWCSRCV